MANMFKNIQAKLFSGKTVPILILIVLVVALFYYSSSKGSILDKMSGAPAAATTTQASAPVAPVASAPPAAPSTNAGGYALQPIANPDELLPKDQNSQWAALNPMGTAVNTPDLLQAGYHIGLDTIGQTLKNANYQLRSDPIIEKKDIGPWLQSTIEPDYGRVPLEIGSGAR